MANLPDERGSFEIEGDTSLPVGPGRDVSAQGSFNPELIDFGHYAGRASRSSPSATPTISGGWRVIPPVLDTGRRSSGS